MKGKQRNKEKLVAVIRYLQCFQGLIFSQDFIGDVSRLCPSTSARHTVRWVKYSPAFFSVRLHLISSVYREACKIKCGISDCTTDIDSIGR